MNRITRQELAGQADYSRSLTSEDIDWGRARDEWQHQLHPEARS
jgi:hypothetical protein